MDGRDRMRSSGWQRRPTRRRQVCASRDRRMSVGAPHRLTTGMPPRTPTPAPVGPAHGSPECPIRIQAGDEVATIKVGDQCQPVRRPASRSGQSCVVQILRSIAHCSLQSGLRPDPMGSGVIAATTSRGSLREGGWRLRRSIAPCSSNHSASRPPCAPRLLVDARASRLPRASPMMRSAMRTLEKPNR